jgi:hypothetical protein
MIQDSNAPSDMQPWVRQTESEIEALKNVIERLSVQLQNAGIGSDVKLNAGLDNTFNFINQEDGEISTEVGAVNFVGEIKSSESLTVDKSITVGERVEFEEGVEGLEAIGSAPYFKISPGSFDVNPVTEKDFYTPAEFLINDTSINMNAYGQISGDGLAITLSNQSALPGYRADILDVTSGIIYEQGTDWSDGDPEDEIPVTIYEVAPTDENIAIITAGQYVNITGCDPEDLNQTNALIVEIDLSAGVYLKFKTLKDSSAITYVAGGEVSSNKPNEVYESILSVRGPGGTNANFGAMVGPEGISVGPDGGNLDEAISVLGRDGLITPSVTAVESFSVGDTRVYIQSEEPASPADGDLWIDPQNSADSEDPFFTGDMTGPRLRLTSTTEASLTSTDHALQIGPTGGVNLLIDNDEIMARNGTSGSIIYVNPHGGNIQLGSATSTISGDGTLSIGNVGDLTSGVITAATGWSVNSQLYRQRNGIAMLSCQFERTGAAISVPANGNIGNSTMGTLASGRRPIIEAFAGTGVGGPVAMAYISTAGSIVLTSVSSGVTIPTGFILDLNSIYIVA